MVHDVEEKAPRHRRGGPLTAEELERPVPACGRQRFPPSDDLRALPVVRLNQFLDGRWRLRRLPLGLAGLDRVDDHFLFARDLPRNLARGAGLWIRTVVGPFRYARDHLARGLRFVLPELREERSFVHAASP